MSGPELRATLLERYGGRCVWCGHLLEVESCTVEHLVPRGRSGERHLLANLAPAHRRCNHKRQAVGVADWLIVCERRGRQPRRQEIVAALHEVAETTALENARMIAQRELALIKQDYMEGGTNGRH